VIVASDNWVETDGARLRYRIEGRGPPILLIHEMGGALESWDGVVCAVGNERTILRYDQRGFGRSTPIAGIVDLDQLVGDALSVWEASDLAAPSLIVGSALGCATAVRLAARYPEYCAGLLLLTPALGVPAERRTGVYAIADQIESRGSEAFIGSTLDVAFPSRFRDPPERLAAFKAIQFATEAASLAAYWRMLAELDLGQDLASLKAPTVILAGSEDRIRPPEQVPRLRDAAFHVVDSGHFMATQTPELVASAIAQFAATH